MADRFDGGRVSYTKRDLPPRTCPACRCPIDECERIREDCTAEAIEVYETACALANIGTGVLIAHLCAMLGAVSTRLTDAEWVTCSDRRKHEIKTMRDLERSLIRIYDAAMVKP